ncbi:MAG: gephyrin-like molybdotransferase Glp [Acidaminococcaceae bacterium]
MELLQTNTLQYAREKLLDYLMEKQEIKTLNLMDAEGQVLAEDVRNICPVPHFRRSTVDGYAVISKDTQGAGESIPVFLENIEEILIGHEATSTLKGGQCAYIPTGGMLPAGADAVVMVEYCEQFDVSSIAVYDSVSVGRKVVNVGEDVESGAVILKQGTTLRPQEIGALASAGISSVNVYAPLKLTIISTGDELVPLGKVPKLGQVRDINTYALQSLAKKCGFDVVATHVLLDEEEILKKVVSESMQQSDFVVLSGGSSQGKKDMSARILDELADQGVFVHGISIKPGKPTILGYDKKSNTALVGLPGHPVAAMIIFELIVVWVKNKLIGKDDNKYIYAKMKTNVGSAPGKTTCQMVRLIDSQGEYFAEPVFGKSGIMSTLTAADGYTLIDLNKEGLRKDEIVKVFLI